MINFDKEAMAKNIWLAGLGAYAKGLNEANELSGRGRSLFEELVERGREVQGQNEEKKAAAKEAVTATVEPRKNALEERINTIVGKLTGIDATRVDSLDSKLDALTAQVEALLNKDAPAEEAEVKTEEAKSA